MAVSHTSTPPIPLVGYTGKVVDRHGHHLAGIWVTRFNAKGIPLQPMVSRADGGFSTACGVKVLLTSWQIGQRQPSSARNLAATWVGGGRTLAAARKVPCGSSHHRTTMAEGGVLEGTFHAYTAAGTEVPFKDGGEPGGGLYCEALGFYLDGPQCNGWQIQGGHYRFVGLPTGTYGLQTTLTFDRTVEVVAGRTTMRDWYDCEQCDRGSIPPSTAPTPSPSRSS